MARTTMYAEWAHTRPVRQHLGPMAVPARADPHPLVDGLAESRALRLGSGTCGCVSHACELAPPHESMLS